MAEDEYEWGVEHFNWMTFPEAEGFLKGLIEDFTSGNNRAGELAGSIEWGTSTRFISWVDHMVAPEGSVDEYELAIMGFVEDGEAETQYGARCFRHRGSLLFPVLLRPGSLWELAIRTESLEAFRNTHIRQGEILGDPFSPYRWLDVVKERDRLLTAVERRGYEGFAFEDTYDVEAYSSALIAFGERPREFPTDADGLQATKELVREQLEELSPDRVADAWFAAEWDFWQATNGAAQVQKARQDALGLGWANHDHQAYRCSREHYRDVVEILELLGMRRREAYYAGDQAGWGAQVLEQPVEGFVVFCDVDMAPDEKDEDFASSGFSELDSLGSIGLWVGLHGESMLQAGIHHLACSFAFERIIQDMDSRGYPSMAPFSDLPFLRQAFTVADGWSVDETRAKALLDQGLIGKEEFEQFGQHGAIGSHLELIERGEGFKGFNQDSVSTIITATDPRGTG
jgi:hypothetical protein